MKSTSETLYSWCARYHRLTGNRLAADTSQQLFGTPNAGRLHDLTSHLAAFVDRTHERFGTVESLAMAHTLLGFYAPFKPADLIQQACKTMAGTSVARLKFQLGLQASRVGATHPLKACPECMADEVRKSGFAVWHLEHQWPSVWICRQHGAWLQQSTIKTKCFLNQQWLLPDDVPMERWLRVSERMSPSRPLLQRMAEMTVDLLASSPAPFDSALLRFTYLAGVKRKGMLRVIQMPNMDMQSLFEARRGFTEEQWIDALVRSTGMEPSCLKDRVKWHLLARMIPLVENNYNFCELGPRGTGKSHIYKEISPNSILVSGGQTTVANLFYNMAARKVGLVGLWDVVAFDEVAGINFKDQDGVQIMKDYMASGSFSRGRESINANASMVFIGNINQSVESLVKTSHLLAPFPEVMIDSAFFDRFHAYVPGWEIPKMRPEFFTNQYGLIVDYLAEYLREMRKWNFADAIDKWFKLGNNLNQRDTIAVRRTVSGLLKLICPHGEYDKEIVRKCLEYALEVRRRIKEQLKKIGGMEFYDVHFSYIDLEDKQERFVTVPEQSGGALIPEGQLSPGTLHTISLGQTEMPGTYRLEIQCIAGSGKISASGGAPREAVRVAFDYFKANSSRISASIKPGEHDFHLHLVELQQSGLPAALTLTSFIALCSAALSKPVQSQMVVMGDMSLGGTIVQVRNLAESLQVAFDAGAKRILLPMSSVTDIPTVPGELFAKFQTSFYSDPVDAVFKALGVE